MALVSHHPSRVAGFAPHGMSKPVLEIWIRNRIAIVDGRRGLEVVARLEPGDRTVVGTYDVADVPVGAVEAAIAGIEDGTYTRSQTEDLGQTLFASIFSGAVLKLYEDAFEPRIRLFIDPPGARIAPWELLHDGKRFLNATMPLSRGIKTASPSAPLEITGPIRVLVVHASPSGAAELDASFEMASIVAALRELPDDKVSVTVLTGATVRKLIDTLREATSGPDRQPFHVLHFIGHGERREDSFVLLFEDEPDQSNDVREAVPVSPEDLVNLISNDADGDQQHDLKLVFLNACRSAQFSAYSASESFAPRVLEAGIPALVGMQNSVFDEVAKVFAADFYAALADRVPIDEALQHAKLAAGTVNPQSVADLGVPVLYMRSDTGLLFAPRSNESVAVPARPPSRPRRIAKWVGVTVVGTIVSAATLFAVVRSHRWYCNGDTRPVSWTCPEAPTMASTRFNVAIAEFDTANGDDRETAESLSETLFENIDDAILEFGFTDVWGPDETGAVRGATARDREAAANDRADAINADVIVYGRLEPSGSGVELVPEFYVNDRRAEFMEANASELTGGYRFGDGETVDPSNLASSNRQFEEAIQGRAAAMAQFVLGLAQYSSRPPDFADAIESFNQAASIEAWQPSEGREILYMFLGNAEGKLATTYAPGSVERQAALDRASTAYDASLAIDSNYARALLGKAEVEFATAGGFDCTRQELDQPGMRSAEQTYRQARSATNAPEHADVDIKARYGIGRIYACERLADVTAGGDPQPVLSAVIEAGDAGNERLAVVAAEAQGLLAALAGHDGNTADAVVRYRDSAKRLESLRLDDRAAIMLRNAAYYQSLDPATCGEADGTYAAALDLADDNALSSDIQQERETVSC